MRLRTVDRRAVVMVSRSCHECGVEPGDLAEEPTHPGRLSLLLVLLGEFERFPRNLACRLGATGPQVGLAQAGAKVRLVDEEPDRPARFHRSLHQANALLQPARERKDMTANREDRGEEESKIVRLAEIQTSCSDGERPGQVVTPDTGPSRHQGGDDEAPRMAKPLGRLDHLVDDPVGLSKFPQLEQTAGQHLSGEDRREGAGAELGATEVAPERLDVRSKAFRRFAKRPA